MQHRTPISPGAMVATLLVVMLPSLTARADVFTRFRDDLADAAPSVATRIRRIAVPTIPSDPVVALHYGAVGLVHPESRRYVCDWEAVGVIAIDQAARVLFRNALDATGRTTEAARIAQIAPIHNGNRAEENGATLRDISRSLRATAPRNMRVPLARAALALHWGLLALGRSRAAPEEFVLEQIVDAARDIVRVLGARGETLVADYAETTFRSFFPARAQVDCTEADYR